MFLCWCSGCDGCCVFCFYCEAWICRNVRNARLRVPMCFRCLIFNLSGPCEFVFLLCFVASWT